MAAITSDDMDRNIVTFCYETFEQQTALGRLRVERLLPWAFVQFPGSGDNRYVSPLTGTMTVGLTAVGGQPYVSGSEYMRNAPWPYEADRGSSSPIDGDMAKPGQFAIHFFGGV